MDSRDFRKQWQKLQESWNSEDTELNINSTKAEKLEEKRKLPDALKAHQFGKKTDGKTPEKGETKKHEDAETPEQEKKEDKKDDKKPSFLKKKATEKRKSMALRSDGKLSKVGKGVPGKTLYGGPSTWKKNTAKATEDVAGNAAAAGASNGSTTSTSVGAAKGTCPDARVGSPVAQPERLKKQAKESKLFSHFRKYMSEAGLPIEAPIQDPAADPTLAGDSGAFAELTGEEPAVDPALGAEAPVDDAAALVADIKARFPTAKIRICVETEPTAPFTAEDVAAAEAAIAAVPEEVEGAEELGGELGADELDGAEMPVDQDIADEVRIESCSMREDEGEDMGAADGVEEIPTGDEMGAEGGEEALGGELGAEVEGSASEASPEAISMTPEQWLEFLAAGTETGTDELDPELGAADAEAGEGEDSDSESNKSEDQIG